ncbi:hypothetical protein WBG78_08385 [Chryseolinea sp. T2]|uniref:hypothetical protein n=1 Tax=Chryseolinea sp. T2 TaxID=3129255 RepID=UPI0030781547
MDKRILTYGASSPLPEAIHLRAGRLTLLYESGFIRYISNGEHEIVRMINHYLRDHNWSTIPMLIESEQVSTTEDSFRIAYVATIRHNNIDFSWKCSIVGHADETISFTIEGKAHSEFKRNRLGFTVLLPTEALRGQTCRVTHPDNVTNEFLFPDAISPHQPFLDIQSMAWSPASGIQAAITFSGDIFEMEDQRNWMDASHKVYCTPLELGFPKTVKEGDQISQSIHLKVFGDLHGTAGENGIVSLSIDTFKGMKLPKLGIPMSESSLTEAQQELIKALSPDFVSVQIRNLKDIEQRIPIALKLGRPLELALFPSSLQAEELALALKPYSPSIIRIILLVEGKRAAGQELIDSFLPSLRKHLPKASIGSGTDAFFTELNRNPTPAAKLDFLSFSVNPQTHASDLRTMTENLVAHRDVVESCRILSGGRQVRVGPITLKMRWNPDATSAKAIDPGQLPDNVDARQLSLFAAGWTLGSLKYLTEAGADMATYYEMAGWRGLMAHTGEPWPETFKISNVQIYPVYLMLGLLLSQRDSTVHSLTSSNPLQVDGMAFSAAGKMTLLLANYTRDALVVRAPGGLQTPRIRIVHSDNVNTFLNQHNTLHPSEMLQGATFSIPSFGFVIIEGVE